MEMKQLMSEIWEQTQHEYLEFVAENDQKCCQLCRGFDGKIFRDDDPERPEIPLHPNCRCRYRIIRHFQ